MAVRTANFALEPVDMADSDEAVTTIPFALVGGTEADLVAADRFFTIDQGPGPSGPLTNLSVKLKDGLYLVTAQLACHFSWTPPVDNPDHPRPYARTVLWVVDQFTPGGGAY